VVTRYFAANGKDVDALVDVTLRVVSACVIPLCVAAMILGRDATLLFYGAEYSEASPLLLILLPYFALTVLNSVFVCVLVGSGREASYTRVVMIGSGVFCIATLLGTAVFGVVGAAGSVVVGEAVMLLLMMYEAEKVVRIPLFTILLQPTIAGAVMMTVAILLDGWNSFVIVGLSLPVFALVEILLKGITRKEIQFLRERFV
jgi:O-antigen/teichoic acid export membrane protein